MAGRSDTMSPQVLLAFTLTASVLLANALQPGLAARTGQHLWPGSVSGADDNAAYACGFFNTSDPTDGGIAHQPCYGMDGTIQFCCLSGSSKCSCPASFASDYNCYNYESDSPLNAVTGAECGYFFPDESAEQASDRRFLATCSGTNPYNKCQTTTTSSTTYGSCTTTKTQLIPGIVTGNGKMLTCSYGTLTNLDVCFYNATSGMLTPVATTSSCCPTTSTCLGAA